MKRIVIFLSLVLLVVWSGVAQDDTAGKPVVAEEAALQDDATTDDAAPTSPSRVAATSGRSHAECGSPRQHYHQGTKP